MLSSITPLGQRSRGMSWGRTVVSFSIGAILAGVVVFAAVGMVGESTGMAGSSLWWPVAVLVAAATADMSRVDPPGPRRQVDENWLGAYRDWVVGLGYGLQLGAGLVTYVSTFGYWGLLVVAAMTGLPEAILLGAGFGVGRSLLLVINQRVSSPQVLALTMRRFSEAQRLARWSAQAGYLVAAVTVGFHAY